MRQGDDLAIWTPICFFMTSIGYTIGWTAISSMLAAYRLEFGPAVLLQLNMAYFLPSIPVLLLQVLFDGHFNKRFGLPKATTARLCIGLGGAALICAVFPLGAPTLDHLLRMTVLLGLCCGNAFGTSYQLVSHFSVSCNVALTIGFVGAGPIILLLEVLDKVGPHPTATQKALVFEVVAFFTLLGLVASLMVLHWHWGDLARVSRHTLASHDSDAERGESQLPLLSDDLQNVGDASRGISDVVSRTSSPRHSDELLRQTLSCSGFEVESAPIARPLRGSPQPALRSAAAVRLSPEAGTTRLTPPFREAMGGVSNAELLKDIWPAALALGVSVGCATVLFPFFTYCPSSGWLQAMLPQVLFFTRTISDIIGRLLPHRWLGLTTPSGLHLMTVTKLAATPLAFWYISSAKGLLSDAAAILFIALFWLQSGVVNSASFVMAPKWARPGAQDRAGGILALVFQLSCLVALGLAFAIERSFPPFSGLYR